MASSTCTPDDLAVLDLVARGWTTRLIAEHRQQSPREVRDQLRGIRSQLEARTNLHAVVLAIRRGLI